MSRQVTPKMVREIQKGKALVKEGKIVDKEGNDLQTLIVEKEGPKAVKPGKTSGLGGYANANANKGAEK